MVRNMEGYRTALGQADHAEALIDARAEAGVASEEGLRIEDAIMKMVKPGYYEHFKSTKESRKYYLVHEVIPSVNFDRGPHAYEVVYESLYSSRAGRKGRRELIGPDGF